MYIDEATDGSQESTDGVVEFIGERWQELLSTYMKEEKIKGRFV
jgi:hypothetical protein